MRTAMLFVTLIFAAGAAQAQIKCWTGADGRRVCGDTPPPGAKVSTIKTPSAPSGPGATGAGGAAAAKGAKGPLTPAQQEQAFRKRQTEGKKSREKAEQERAEAADKKFNCDRAQEQVRMLEGGQRVARTNAQGERYFIDDGERAGEVAAARRSAGQWCK